MTLFRSWVMLERTLRCIEEAMTLFLGRLTRPLGCLKAILANVTI